MEQEISLGELFLIIKQHIIKILIWAMLGLIIMGVYTFFFVTPEYESTSKIVVNQTQNIGQTITNNDIQTNLNLINTYQSIIREPIILEDVILTTESELTVDQLRDKISFQTQSNSLVFGVIVNDDSPYLASELANIIAKSFEEKIGDIIEVESVTILSEAIPNLNPVSPNIILNLVLGTVVGLIIGVVFAFMDEFMDKRVKSISIIEELGWINLGSVLEMTNNEVVETRINRNINNYENTKLKRRV